jgi:membrane protease YdiL (CAAX protease family)
MNETTVRKSIALESTHPNAVPWVWIVVGLSLPSLVTWVYFVLLSEQSSWIQQAAYGLGKGIQFLLPVVVVAKWGSLRRGMIPLPENRGSETLEGDVEDAIPSPSRGASEVARWLDWISGPFGAACVGLAIAALMILVYRGLLLPLGGAENARIAGEEKMRSMGFASPVALLGVGAFYAIFHSGFEEFYWRGFVFSGLRSRLGTTASIWISSLGFMSHHVLVLGKFFGWNSVQTYLFAASVAVGGAIWAVILWRSKRLIPSWISHGVVDAAIFLIAWHLIFVSQGA